MPVGSAVREAVSSPHPQPWTASARVDYRTILHIDDDWVYAIIVELHPASALIVGAARERRLESGPQIQATTLAPICEEVLRRAEDMTGKVVGAMVIPDEAMISVRGPHLQTITCSVRVRRPDPSKMITQRELKRFFERLYRAAEAQTGLAGSESTGADFEFIHADVAQVLVDGHAVTTPVRFRGEILDGSALLLSARSSVMTELRALSATLKLSARAIAVPWALANLQFELDTLGMILDAHETCLYRVQAGRVAALESCPYGSENLSGDLAINMGLPQYRVSALERAFSRGDLDDAQCAWLEEAMQYSFRQWFQTLGPALAKMAELGPLPSRLCYWEISPNWPIIGHVLNAWMETWDLVEFPDLRRCGFADVSSVGDRTGTIAANPARTVLSALAHHAGSIRDSDAMSESLRSIALR